MKINKKLIDRIKKIYSESDFDLIIKWFSSERKTSFRINTLKWNREKIENFLNSKNILFQKINYSDIIYIIDKKDEYTLKWSDIFYNWEIYLQWISSMIPVMALNPKKWDKILDTTAAPWSKTTQIAALIENNWEIVACEQNQIRFDKLNYNIDLQWANCIKTHKLDALKLKNIYPENYFDKILLDAPCSAEGRINLNIEKTYWFWSLENIYKKQKIQLELLQSVIPLLKKWWELVYSTCTMAPEENEEVINEIINLYNDLEIIETYIDLIDYTRDWIVEFGNKKFINEIKKTKRILPSNITEGFYIAKLKKLI